MTRSGRRPLEARFEPFATCMSDGDGFYVAFTRRYRATASGAKIAISAKHQTNDIHMGGCAPLAVDRHAGEHRSAGTVSLGWGDAMVPDPVHYTAASAALRWYGGGRTKTGHSHCPLADASCVARAYRRSMALQGKVRARSMRWPPHSYGAWSATCGRLHACSTSATGRRRDESVIR